MGGNKSLSGPSGRVIAHYGLRVHIKTGDGVVEWKPPRRESWVVGDMVVFDNGRPKTIAPRRTELARIAADGARQPLAANLDSLLIVTACGSAYKPQLIDRFIVSARHAGLEPSVILNKIDGPDSNMFINMAAMYEKYGVALRKVCALTGEGMVELTASLAGRVSALVGESGVGKTSILNRIAPSLSREVGEVNVKTGAGKHTTTVSLLVDLPGGGAIIDSPGIRTFTPSGLEPRDVAGFFPSFEKFHSGCRFRDCLHLTEPGCAVTEAVNEGGLDKERYESYTRLLQTVKDHSEPEW